MSEQSSNGSVGRFIGLAIVIAAVLWMACSGLCAATMVYDIITSGGPFDANAAGWTFLILFFSGISAAMAYALFVVGRGLSARK
jgi:hypothetical protein